MPPQSRKRGRHDSPDRREQQRAREVYDALKRQDRNRLHELAYSPLGFGSSELRRAVWLFLLGIDPQDAVDASWRHKLACLQEDSQDAKVIKADVQRSVYSWDVHTGLGQKSRDRKRVQLSEVMHAILQKHGGHLGYFQGFHDIVLVFLEVGTPSQAFHMVERMALFQLSDQLCHPFDKGLMPLLGVLFHLLSLVDKELAAHLFEAECSELHFAVPWVLTFFAHSLPQLNQVMRLFDCLLCSHPAAILYFSAALLLLHREAILQAERDLPEVVCAIQTLPLQRLDAEAWVSLAGQLMQQVPPAELLKRLPPTRQLAIPANSPLRHYPHPWARPGEPAVGELSRQAPVYATPSGAKGALFAGCRPLWMLSLQRLAFDSLGMTSSVPGSSGKGGLLARAVSVLLRLLGISAILLSARALAGAR